MKFNTDSIIDGIVDAKYGDGSSMAERHMFRENLRALVRLAKTEQMAEIRQNASKLAGNFLANSFRRRARMDAPGRSARALQRQFEFNRHDFSHSDPACGDSCDE